MVKHRVLLIEDDALLRELYEYKLITEGFEVEAANDGLEGLQKARANVPHIILLDMMMPNLSGLEFLKAYDEARSSHVKILVLSNKSAPNEMDDAKQLGAADYLIKSHYTPDDIVVQIRKHLTLNA